LADGDSAAAMKAFQLALDIDAIDRAANIGHERAKTLDDVLALIIAGDKLLEKNMLEQAKASYQEALDLDSNANTAKQQIHVAEQKIITREFNRRMSTGFNALGNNQYVKAQQSFTKALKLKPKSTEARTALIQTNHNITTDKINTLLAQAKQLENQERWHDALSKYNSALALDASLADAQLGQERTSIRAKIHDRLEQILAQRGRLFDRAVYEETINFQTKLRAVSNPGPILTKQLNALTGLLSKAITPVSISLKSNNQTKVTIYKIGELGYFASKELSIRPGRYVAVGYREGYRDVRIEFTVDPDKPLVSISIQAEEKIAFGN